jgi:transposase, IS5 family
VELGLEDGSKLRVDTTVVETDIHHPTDNTLLWDVVRVLTRLVKQLAKALKRPRIKGFCDRSRSAHRRMYEIQRMTTRQRQGSQQTEKYRELIEIAEEVVTSATSALDATATMRATDLPTALKIESIRADIEHHCGLGARVIDQARRRVLNGEQVPTAEKIYSIFEPHTDLIKRGKVRPRRGWCASHRQRDPCAPSPRPRWRRRQPGRAVAITCFFSWLCGPAYAPRN